MTPESDELLQVPRTWCSDAIVSRFVDLIESCFDISAEQSQSNSVKYALTNLKDSAVAAVRDKRTGSLERVVDIYVRLGTEFLHELQVRTGDGFTLDQALAESRNLFAGWQDVMWIRDHFEDLLSMAVQTGDRDIVDAVLHLPTSLIAEAIKCSDLYIFNVFRSFPLILYRHLAQTPDQLYRRFLVQRSHQYLTEVCNYVIMARLRSMSPKPPAPRRLIEFATATLLTFQDLLVLALHARDVSSFQSFHNSALTLLPWVGQFEGPPSTGALRAWLEQPIPSEKREEIQRELEFRQERHNQLLQFDERKSQMLFGVASLAFESFKKEGGNAILKEIYGVAAERLPRSIPKLSSLFARCYDIKVENFWGWVGWHLPQEEFGSFDSFGPLLRIFAFELLRRVESSDPATIRSLEFSDRAAIRLMSSLVDLRATIDKIVEETRDFGFSLPDPNGEKMAALHEVLERLKKEEKTEEEDLAIASTPSEEMIRWFANGVVQGFRSEATLRAIIGLEPAAYQDLTDSMEPITVGEERFGLKRLAGKEVLLREPERAYEALGVQFGSGIGRGENETLLRQIAQAVPSAEEITEEGAGAVVDQVVAALDSSRRSGLVVIVVECFPVLEYWRAQGRLQEPTAALGKEATPVPEGYYGESKIPVFHLYGSRFSGRVLVLDLTRFGRLIQYRPTETNDGGVLTSGFFVSLRDLNREDSLRQEVLEQHRAELSLQTDPDRYLRLAVLVEVFERFALAIDDARGIRCFVVKH